MAGTGNLDQAKIMLVDDSAVIRGLYRRMLEGADDIEIVAAVGNGQEAIDALNRKSVDVIVLDIEMPVMDGLTAIPHLLKARPNVSIIMSSTLSAKNAEISIKAMNAGAADYIQKPSSSGGMPNQQDFKADLLNKIRALHKAALGKPVIGTPAPGVSGKTTSKAVTESYTVRDAGRGVPGVVVIGSSTGGPKALIQVFSNLPATIGIPVAVAQHMPPTFTKTLAAHINDATDWQCHEGEDGEALVPGTALFAPGGYHMVIERAGSSPVVRLNQDPPVNFCRPAVDPLFHSASDAYGSNVLAVVLTGMGRDGLKGAEAIIAGGGTVYAQDKETSVVWGMPGVVANAGLCSKLLPLSDVAASIERSVMGAAA